MKVEVIKWSHGKSLYLNDYRISGSKPWSGGQVFLEFDVTEEDIIKALGCKICQCETKTNES